MKSWWLSFVDKDRPVGSRCIGVCVVPQADDLKDALQKAIGTVPLPRNGEVCGVRFSPEWNPEMAKFEPLRFYTLDEVKAITPTRTLGELRKAGEVKS